jgi:Putative Actinobacterial Holin-X, holin superfamily III
MADVRELPDHVREFVSMSTEYLRQETVVPAKQLGSFAGMSLGAALCFVLAALFFGIAGTRYLIMALPEGPNWEALGYVLGAIAMAAVAAVLIKITAASTKESPS